MLLGEEGSRTRIEISDAKHGPLYVVPAVVHRDLEGKLSTKVQNYLASNNVRNVEIYRLAIFIC
jgi:hypothetical protein